jgi:hypothetical protein
LNSTVRDSFSGNILYLQHGSNTLYLRSQYFLTHSRVKSALQSKSIDFTTYFIDENRRIGHVENGEFQSPTINLREFTPHGKAIYLFSLSP